MFRIRKPVIYFASFKVNRRQTRQGELRSKRESAGGEGALGGAVRLYQAQMTHSMTGRANLCVLVWSRS